MSYNAWKMFQGIFGMVFIWCRILALFPPCVTILAYNLDALGIKSVSLSVHRAIRMNSENTEQQNIHDGIHVFFLQENEPQKPQNLKKIFRKSPASNA